MLTIFLSIVWLGLIGIAVAGAAYREKPKAWHPFSENALVIVPCKGMDITIEKNLHSIKKQECGKIKIVAVVDSINDAAVKTIKDVGIKLAVSSQKYKHCSGKVAAICTALSKFKGYSAYAIIDSDVECEHNHIKDLLAPLTDPKIGISTAYPYFNPIGGFWAKVKMVWGFVGNGMMESELTRFGWGGSIAFRGGMLGRKELAILSKAISDDIALVHIAKQKGLRIEYVNNAKIKVNVRENRKSFFEWSNRQTALTLLGNRKLLYMGVSLYLAQLLLLVLGITLSIAVSLLYLILLLPFALSAWKAFQRAKRDRLWVLPISFIINFIFLWNLIKASKMKQITWRGRTYPLTNPF